MRHHRHIFISLELLNITLASAPPVQKVKAQRYERGPAVAGLGQVLGGGSRAFCPPACLPSTRKALSCSWLK